eukprot:38495-Chlamydomonas_euryale.AAC.1
MCRPPAQSLRNAHSSTQSARHRQHAARPSAPFSRDRRPSIEQWAARRRREARRRKRRLKQGVAGREVGESWRPGRDGCSSW